jgi:hypothetical protein
MNKLSLNQEPIKIRPRGWSFSKDLINRLLMLKLIYKVPQGYKIIREI